MVAELRYFNSLELEVDSLRSQLETQKTQFLNEIDRLFKEYYYADHMNAILGVYTKLDKVTNLQCDYLELLEKCECLETKLSKSKIMSKSFESVQKQAINLEIELQQCKEKIKNDKLFKDKGIVISELKKLIEKLKQKSVDTNFEKSSVIRQPNAFKSQRPSVLGKPTTFSNSFVRKDFSKSKFVTQNNVSNDFSKPVTAQSLPTIKKSILKNTNLLAPGISNPMGDRVMRNNSQGKNREVEVQRRNVMLPKNKTSVTAWLNHNLFSVGQFCDADLEVAFRKSTCFIRDLNGNDLLTGSRGTDLYSITLQDTNCPNLICLMAKATSSQAWLWHRRLSHLNFNTINFLSKNDIVEWIVL
nr:integrase, catalytic region, zinc finger, CCHC-type, peptidase aspartic, catalytic [Tanacetum cinerariifolium]